MKARSIKTQEIQAKSPYIKIDGPHGPQYWESEATRPKQFQAASEQGQTALNLSSKSLLAPILQHPYQAPETIQRQQWERVRELVTLAYEAIPVYRKKYQNDGFHPEDLKDWQDFERLPLITKEELLAAFPDGCVNPQWPLDDLFSTRSFGTSGRTLHIKVDMDAIVKDTLQGIRQFWLQSGMRHRAHHHTAMIYTVPWWFDAVGEDFPCTFISGVIPAAQIIEILNDLRPEVISCYPTTLKSLLPYLGSWDRTQLYLAVVHSEASSRSEREVWSQLLGVPVRDEYSSEEATRIALELPCGHYHSCDDTVHLEVVDPLSNAVLPDGQWGRAVVTNLLNEAMPFIRYVQGDFIRKPEHPEPCLIGWGQVASIEGRINDSFINREGRIIPAGSVLDVIYRWMHDGGIYLEDFEMVQKSQDKVEVALKPLHQTPVGKIRESRTHLQNLLQTCVGHPVALEFKVLDQFPARTGKRRLIQRSFVL